jgi:adenosylcobinamide-phosphate synthase
MFASPDRVLILIAACGIEAVLAYPALVFGAIGHPVSWIGALISKFESRLNRVEYSAAWRWKWPYAAFPSSDLSSPS